MFKQIYLFMFLTFTLIIVFFNCQFPVLNPESENSIPTKTIVWQDDGNGFLQYLTNDKAKYNSGYLHMNNTIQNTMSYVETQVKKISGSANSGYGIIFCYQDYSNYYRILIVQNGGYQIVRKVDGVNSFYLTGGSWSTTTPASWPISGNLNINPGSVNTIKVENTGSGNFNLFFNGNKELSFTDSSFTGGDSGYYAFIYDSAHENFPKVPEDMRFKQTYMDLSTANSVQTINWQFDGNGFFQYSTNDTNNCGIQQLHILSPNYSPMSSVEIQVKKMSGYSSQGYGMVFCFKDGSNYYRIWITVNGTYIICKKVNGNYFYYVSSSWSTAQSWLTSINLNSGYNTTNIIKVINGGSGNFDLYFNGVKETSFSDTTFTGGYNGYYASIGSVGNENFLVTPADVRCRLISAN